jgi:hypothetical protein
MGLKLCRSSAVCLTGINEALTSVLVNTACVEVVASIRDTSSYFVNVRCPGSCRHLGVTASLSSELQIWWASTLNPHKLDYPCTRPGGSASMPPTLLPAA